MPTGTARSFAITLRPRDGWSDTYHPSLMKFLHSYCEQWSFYLEHANESAASAHLHGSILLKYESRRDKIQDKFTRTFAAVLDDDEMRTAQRGITFLYSDWLDTYVANNADKPDPGTLYEEHLTDDPWSYSTDADKKSKKGYNATQELKRKMALFHETWTQGYPVTVPTVETWYEFMVLSEEFAVPTSDPTFKTHLRWLTKFINFNAPETSDIF